jgi:mono/diheme cytochrome c family protein
MKLTHASFTGWLLLFVFAAGTTYAQDKRWDAELRPFFTDHCLTCHSGADSEGGLNLAALGSDLSDAERLRRWTLVHDRVAAGEMPPPDQPAPNSAQRAAVVRNLAKALTAADQARNDVVLRRLNRLEYENTVRDLFGTWVQVAQALPQDASVAGFDNVGEGLAVSAEAAQAYLEAADLTMNAVFGSEKPPTFIRHETNLLLQFSSHLQIQ